MRESFATATLLFVSLAANGSDILPETSNVRTRFNVGLVLLSNPFPSYLELKLHPSQYSRSFVRGFVAVADEKKGEKISVVFGPVLK